MAKASSKQAAIMVLTALLQRPHKTSELDEILGWRNSPQAVLDRYNHEKSKLQRARERGTWNQFGGISCIL